MDRRIAKTKDAIFLAYKTIMQTADSKKITVSDIAREANIDRKTFYAHYESVDDVLKSYWRERVQEFLEKLRDTPFFSQPLELIPVFLELNTIMERDRELYRVLLENGSYSFFWEEIQSIVAGALVDAYKDMVRVSEEELRLYCEFFVAGIARVYQEYLKNPSETAKQQMGKVILEIAQNGTMKLAK